MTTELDLAEIEALAKAAASGRWTWSHTVGWAGCADVLAPDAPAPYVDGADAETGLLVCDRIAPENAAHIARMDPETTLRMLEMIAEKDAEIVGLKASNQKLERSWREFEKSWRECRESYHKTIVTRKPGYDVKITTKNHGIYHD